MLWVEGGHGGGGGMDGKVTVSRVKDNTQERTRISRACPRGGTCRKGGPTRTPTHTPACILTRTPTPPPDMHP